MQPPRLHGLCHCSVGIGIIPDLSSADCIDRAVLKGEVMRCGLVDFYVGLQGSELSDHCQIGFDGHDVEVWLLR